MQIIDGMVLVHNLDSKTSLAYDLKLIEYNQPILPENLQVDHSYVNSKFLLDKFLAEELD